VSAPQRYRSGAYGAMVADDKGPWVRWSDVWQPIESAPKDGTLLLCFSERLGLIVAGYDTIVRRPEKKQILDYSRWRVDWDGDYLATAPTHWMPLPEPPK
jgi:hypothetical protein